MNLTKIFKDQYTPEQIEDLQRQYDDKSVKSYGKNPPDFSIDPIEEIEYPFEVKAKGKIRSWVLDKLGIDQFIVENMNRLVNSPIRLVFVVHDTAGKFNDITGLNQYEVDEWSGDNTGTGQLDDHDHGHMVASTIVGDLQGNDIGILRYFAKIGKVVVVADKVMSKGSGSFAWIAKGAKRTIDLPYNNNDMIIHVNSYGALGIKAYAPLDTQIDRSIGMGQVWLASSGNSGNDPSGKSRVGYPAVNPKVTAIGATKEDDTIQGYSSTGPEVYAVSGSGVPVVNKEGLIRTVHGTSFSQPIAAAITGLIALYLGRKVTQEEVHTIHREMSQDLGADGHDKFFGYGIIKGDLIKDHIGDTPEEPEQPEEPTVEPYPLTVVIKDVVEKYKVGGEQGLREIKYDEMVLRVTSNEDAAVFTDKVTRMLHDYMKRHYLYFPNDWGQPRTPAIAARMTDMFFDRNHGITIDIESVTIGIGSKEGKNSTYNLEGDELASWKDAPDDIINTVSTEMIEIPIS